MSSLIPSIQDELVDKILALKPREIWLFGSYSKGNPTPASDIDILVVKKRIKESLHPRIVKLRDELKKLEAKYAIEIDLFVDTYDNINEKILDGDIFYNSVFKNATRIYYKQDESVIIPIVKSKFDKIVKFFREVF